MYVKYVSYLYFKWLILYNEMLDTRVYPSPTLAECVVITEVTALFVIMFLIRWRAVYFIASLFAARKARRGHFRNETHSHRYNGNMALLQLLYGAWNCRHLATEATASVGTVCSHIHKLNIASEDYIRVCVLSELFL
jgi:hypothetical protein